MDFYKNADKLGIEQTIDTRAKGVQYTVINDLATEPVTIEFFKDHARIDFDTDDALVSSYLISARQFLERWAGLSFGVKTIRLTALQLPTNYKLNYGTVDTVSTTGFTNVGDILKEGGNDVSIDFTTLGVVNETVKIAICRYAAGLYINRENITNTKLSGQVKQDEAKQMLMSFRNITLL